MRRSFSRINRPNQASVRSSHGFWTTHDLRTRSSIGHPGQKWSPRNKRLQSWSQDDLPVCESGSSTIQVWRPSSTESLKSPSMATGDATPVILWLFHRGSCPGATNRNLRHTFAISGVCSCEWSNRPSSRSRRRTPPGIQRRGGSVSEDLLPAGQRCRGSTSFMDLGDGSLPGCGPYLATKTSISGPRVASTEGPVWNLEPFSD